MANIIELVARLRDEASRGLELLGTNLRKVADVGLEPIAKISPTAAHALGSLLDKVGPTGLALAAIGGATVAAVAGLVAITKNTADLADELRETSLITGVSIAAIQGLRIAMVKSGISGEEFATTFRFMQRTLDNVSQGSTQAGETFRRLGVDINAIRGLKPEQQFEVLSKAIDTVQDPTTKAALSMEVFGRQGSKLIPTFKDVAEIGIGGLVTRAKELGGVIRNETAEQADVFNDTLVDLGKTAQAISVELGAALLPVLTQVAEGWVVVVKAVTAFLRETGLLTAVVTALQVVLFAAHEPLKLIVATVVAATQALKGDFAGALDTLKGATTAVGVAFQKTFLGMADAPKAVAVSVQAAADAIAPLGEAQKKFVQEQAAAAAASAAAIVEATAKAAGDELGVLAAQTASKRTILNQQEADALKSLVNLNLGVAQTAESRAAIEQNFANQRVALTIAEEEQKKAILARQVAEVTAAQASLLQAVAGRVAQERQIQGDLVGAETARRDASIQAAQDELAAYTVATRDKYKASQQANDLIAAKEKETGEKITAINAAAAAQIQQLHEARAAKQVELLNQIDAAEQQVATAQASAQNAALDGEAKVKAARLRAAGDVKGAEDVLARARIDGIRRVLAQETQRHAATIQNLQRELALQQTLLASATNDDKRAQIQATIAGLIAQIATEEAGLAATRASSTAELEAQQIAMEAVASAQEQATQSSSVFAAQQRAATDALTAQYAAIQAAGQALTASVNASSTSIQDLRKQLGQLSSTTSFAFVQDPKLRAQIDQMRFDIVQASGAQRIALVAQLDALLAANKAQLDADRVADQIQDEMKALDERRNQLLEQIKAEQEKIFQAFGAFFQQQQANQQQQMNQPIFQGGGIVRGALGQAVPIVAHAGELVVPADVTRHLLRRRGHEGRFQEGGVVTSGGGDGLAVHGGINVTIQGNATATDADRIARTIATRIRDLERRRAMS